MNSKKNIKSFLGLRGILVLIILFYYYFPRTIVGGHLAFNMLMTLWGYELTRNYLSYGPWEREDLLDQLKKFILPLFTVITISTVLAMITDADATGWYQNEALSGLFGLNNWVQIHQDTSFLTPHNGLNLFSNLWLISLKFQFILLWFLIFYDRNDGKSSPIRVLILIGATLLSALIMFILELRGASVNRVFMGTDTRFFSFGIGAIFGILGTQGMGRKSHEEDDMIAMTIFAILMIALIVFPMKSWLFYLGLFIYSVLTGMFLLFISRDDNAAAHFLHNSVLQGIGKCGYGMYLVQWPLLALFNLWFKESSLPYEFQVLIQLALVAVMGYLLYYFFNKKKYKVGPFKWVSGITALLFLSVFLYSNPMAATAYVKRAANVEQDSRIERKKKAEKKESEIIRTDFIPSAEVATAVEQVNAQYPTYFLDNMALEKLDRQAGLMIGDGLTSKSQGSLKLIMPNMQINGAEGRQLSDMVQHVKNSADNMANINTPIVIQFGEDADFTMSSLNEIIDAAGQQTVILVNSVRTNPWRDNVNQKLARAAKENKYVYLVDLASAVEGNYDFFEKLDEKSEGQEQELTPEEMQREREKYSLIGQRLYAQMVGKVISELEIRDRTELREVREMETSQEVENSENSNVQLQE